VLGHGLAVLVMLHDGTFGPPIGPESSDAASAASRSPGSDAPETRAPARRPQFVREAQRALRDLGYSPGPIDGTVGPRTRAALAKYQSAEKLPVTGELDAETTARLDVHRRLFRPRES
jgi:peptidoglycan hydrolase-like protein with peptidoglycan-binding domain